MGGRKRQTTEATIIHPSSPHQAADKGYSPPLAACKGFWSRANPRADGVKYFIKVRLPPFSGDAARLAHSGGLLVLPPLREETGRWQTGGVRGAAVERGVPAVLLSPG